MFAAIVLICSLAIAPRDCTTDNAVRYSWTVGEWALPQRCTAEAMMHAAELAAEDPRKWDTMLEGSANYTKLSCTRSDFLNHG